MENQDKTAPETGAKPKECSPERQLEVAEVTVAVLKEVLEKQNRYIQNLESQVGRLNQEVAYLCSGGPTYQDKTWLEKVVHCIEDVGGEQMNAAQILRHLEQRDNDYKLTKLKDARKMLSVVLSRGVKTGRLYTNYEVGVSGRVYGVN